MGMAVEAILRRDGDGRPLLSGGAGDLGPAALADLIGGDCSLGALKRQLPLLADCEAPMLVIGESGSGKLSCARVVHGLSERRAKPILSMSCRGLSPERFDHELFGRWDAETGSDTSGLLARAQGGTLFLDAIEMLGSAAQLKLLRLLDEDTYHAAGCSRLRRADVRLIAGTEMDLRDAVRGERFRADLYYRLAVMSVAVPPLRHRAGDIPDLIRHLWRRHAGGRPDARTPAVSPAAMAALGGYWWPGNVGELEDVIRELAPRHLQTITPEHLPSYIARG